MTKKDFEKYQDIIQETEKIVNELKKHYDEIHNLEYYREMLDKHKDIDAVTISTPDHVHGPAAVYAMERDKHVYVQKPITHNIREARMLTNLARKQKVVTQMGNQGGSNPLLKMVQNWVDSGKIGKIYFANIV